MSLLNSSISNSRPGQRPQLRDCTAVALWTLVFLIAADVSINFVFSRPSDQLAKPSELARFFDYGRSIEGKLRQMVADEDAKTAPLAIAGWIMSDHGASGPLFSKGENLNIAAYGMSFTFRICQIISEMDDTVDLHMRGGPAAPLSHSYAMYLSERPRQNADVVIIGVLASSLPALKTMSHMTWNFEAPSPYTYPRFMATDEGLLAIAPTIGSLVELRAALKDADTMATWRTQLREHDRFYAEYLFTQDFFDSSVIARMLRRAIWQTHQRGVKAVFRTAEGFRSETGVTHTALALLKDFARNVREDGAVPIVLLIHDSGYADHLHRALAPTLHELGVSYFSTHEIVPANDHSKFLRDGHFTRPKEEQVAQELLTFIRELRAADSSVR